MGRRSDFPLIMVKNFDLNSKLFDHPTILESKPLSMKPIISAFLFLWFFGFLSSEAQVNEDQTSEAPVWTEEDRNYLAHHLARSLEELTAEVQDLTEAQWNFKEHENSWNINQIVEHLAIYEVIFMNEISAALQMGEFPQIKNYAPDSLFLGNNPNRLETTDYTKPFSHTVPLGNNQGIDNLTWITTMRSDSIAFVKTEQRNLRRYYVNFGPNIHQKCMAIFSHTDRHLRQVKSLKSHPNFPES